MARATAWKIISLQVIHGSGITGTSQWAVQRGQMRLGIYGKASINARNEICTTIGSHLGSNATRTVLWRAEGRMLRSELVPTAFFLAFYVEVHPWYVSSAGACWRSPASVSARLRPGPTCLASISRAAWMARTVLT